MSFTDMLGPLGINVQMGISSSVNHEHNGVFTALLPKDAQNSILAHMTHVTSHIICVFFRKCAWTGAALLVEEWKEPSSSHGAAQQPAY
eukprot:5645810-Amphidinium_carterae.1